MVRRLLLGSGFLGVCFFFWLGSEGSKTERVREVGNPERERESVAPSAFLLPRLREGRPGSENRALLGFPGGSEMIRLFIKYIYIYIKNRAFLQSLRG